MIVLSPKYPGLFFICEQCGALVGDVRPNEIYENNNVYCPICHWINKLQYDSTYNGEVKENETNASDS